MGSVGWVGLKIANRLNFVDVRRLRDEIEPADVICNTDALIGPENVDEISAIPASMLGLCGTRPAG